MRLNADVFYMDYKDLQVTQTNAACLCNITDNAASAVRLSMAATARVIDSASERQHAARLLKRKFPTLAEFGDPERERGWAFLQIEPKVISLIDYTKGFGHTVLIPV